MRDENVVFFERDVLIDDCIIDNIKWKKKKKLVECVLNNICYWV